MADRIVRIKPLWLVSVLLYALPLQVRAAPDSATDHCWKQNYEGDVRKCLGNLEKKSQTDMDVALTQALGRQENMDPAAVRASQDAFIHYRDVECGVEGDTMRGGTNDADYVAMCTIDKNTARAAELSNDVALTYH